MSLLEKIFKSFAAEEIDPNFSADLQQIEGILSGIPEEEARDLAAVAMLLGRIANADNEISVGEREKMTEIMQTTFKLPTDLAQAVTTLSLSKISSISLDHHIVIRRINESYDRAQKLNLISVLFKVATVDDISEVESDEIRHIAKSMMIADSEYMQLRSEHRDYLSILK